MNWKIVNNKCFTLDTSFGPYMDVSVVLTWVEVGWTYTIKKVNIAMNQSGLLSYTKSSYFATQECATRAAEKELNEIGERVVAFHTGQPPYHNLGE